MMLWIPQNGHRHILAAKKLLLNHKSGKPRFFFAIFWSLLSRIGQFFGQAAKVLCANKLRETLFAISRTALEVPASWRIWRRRCHWGSISVLDIRRNA
jgi:hypothetical protein